MARAMVRSWSSGSPRTDEPADRAAAEAQHREVHSGAPDYSSFAVLEGESGKGRRYLRDNRLCPLDFRGGTIITLACYSLVANATEARHPKFPKARTGKSWLFGHPAHLSDTIGNRLAAMPERPDCAIPFKRRESTVSRIHPLHIG